MIYKTEDLVNSIKVRSVMPTSQTTFSDSDLILLLNEEMLISLVPDVQKVRENYFLRSISTAIESGNASYIVPERAIGGGLREVFFLDGESRYRLPQRKISDLELNYGNGNPEAFFLVDNSVNLFPTPTSSSGSVELWYYSRPSDLVPTSECGKLDTITPGVSEVTFTLDTDLSASIVTGSSVDIISTRSPNRIQVFNAVVQSISGVTVSLLLADCVGGSGDVIPQVGDYLCVSGTSNIPQIPVELHPILAQMVTARVVEALGDMQKLQMVNAKLTEMRTQAIALIANRVENEPISLRNTYGMFGNMRSRWFWRGLS